MVMYTLGIGSMIKHMEKVNMCISMGLNIMVIGSMINSMEKELKHEQMVPYMKENILKE